MDHQEQGKIKHINRMKSTRIVGLSQDISATSNKSWTEKTKRRNGIIENKYNLYRTEATVKYTQVQHNHATRRIYLRLVTPASTSDSFSLNIAKIDMNAEIL
jgi:hypothetical protein